MTELVWSDKIASNWLTANGARGVYQIREVRPDAWKLTGKGHDGLSIMHHRMDKTYPNAALAKRSAALADSEPPAGELSGC